MSCNKEKVRVVCGGAEGGWKEGGRRVEARDREDAGKGPCMEQQSSCSAVQEEVVRRSNLRKRG